MFNSVALFAPGLHVIQYLRRAGIGVEAGHPRSDRDSAPTGDRVPGWQDCFDCERDPVFRRRMETRCCSDEWDRSQQTPTQYRPTLVNTGGRNVAPKPTLRVKRVLIYCTYVYNGGI
jgi:hypothetical protein